MNIYLKCQCCSHLLEVECDDEITDGDYYFSIWNKTINGKLCWKERFRWIWRILITGSLWADHVVLTEDQIKELEMFFKNAKYPKKTLLHG